eukprot:8554038-Alexandrium_andersonii.AAC.1
MCIRDSLEDVDARRQFALHVLAEEHAQPGDAGSLGRRERLSLRVVQRTVEVELLAFLVDLDGVAE